MATQVIGALRRNRLSAALIALALAMVVVVLAAQASTMWSDRTVPQVSPAAGYSFSLPTKGNHMPEGCRPKYGCQPMGTAGQLPGGLDPLPRS